MTNRFNLPLQTPVDATGTPYSGGKLFFYESGTDTKLDTYSNKALTIANTNPVVLDSAGRFPNAIFLQNLAYKVVFAPSTDSDPPTSPIWTQDPVYTSDYSTLAQVNGVNGSPNGQLAGTAASATIPASMAWDYTNNILYVCTTTGSTSTAVWTAVNAATAAAVVPPPQGYLTLTSGVPIIPGDVAAATTVYYTPYTGVLVPIYNGTSFVPTSIVTERQLTLTSSHAANNIYDFFIFSLNGVATLGTGPSWSAGTGGSITAGSCARGTGAGGAALSRLTGVLTNAVSMTIRYGDGTTTTTVNANEATYVGSMFVDGTNGQVSCYRSYGQSRKWGIWNAYNRAPVYLKAGDATASWTYATATFRPSNNSTANSLTIFSGLAEDTYSIQFDEKCDSNPSSTSMLNGIGYNSTSVPSGYVGELFTYAATQTSMGSAKYLAAPALGINVITALEKGQAGSTENWYGTEANMVLSAAWRA